MSEPLQAVQPQADEADPDTTEVPLVTSSGEVVITVPPTGKWKSRANTFLAQGDMQGWADTVLSEDDAEAWAEADPTNDESTAFFKAWGELSGEKVSRNERRATRRSRRR